MAMPSDITSITVSATYLDPAGEPCRGFVTFTPSITATTEDNIFAVPLRAELTPAGLMSIVLAATDDPDWLAPGWTYLVVEAIEGAPVRAYSIEVPFDGGAIDLATVAPVISPAAVTPYILRTQIGVSGGVASYAHSHGGGGGPVEWDDIEGKPTTFDTTAAKVTDATTVGRNVLTAANQAAARTAIGAGTSNLAIGASGTDAAAGNHTHGGGGGSSVTVSHGYVKTGNVTPQTTASFAAVTGGPTGAIPAAVGDTVEFHFAALIDLGASGCFFDICVLVGGAAVRYASSGGAAAAVEGDPGMYGDTTDYRPQNGLGMVLEVESGDLEGGNVTFGLAVINPGGGGSVFASNSFPFRWRCINYGPQ